MTEHMKADDCEVLFIDEYGRHRILKKCADCDYYEGVHDIGSGPEPYWLPERVVETRMPSNAA